MAPDLTPAPPPKATTNYYEQIAGSADRVRKAIKEAQFKLDLPTPEAIDAHGRRCVDQLLEEGVRALRTRPLPTPQGFLVGFDFGTSSTKIVLHNPARAGDPAAALTVPTALRAEGTEHLWRTALWFAPDSGRFSLYPRPGWTAIDDFKAALIQGRGRATDHGVTHEEAACAYLAMMIAVTLGFRELHPPAGFGPSVGFSRFHFGVPVASRDDGPVATAFRRVFEAAFAAAPSAEHLTLVQVRTALQSIGPCGEPTAETPYVMYEELSAVIAGYLKSADRRLGPHMAIDVGAATLDVTAFWITEGDHPVQVYAASVETFGAAALHTARVAGVSDDDFFDACHHQAQAVWEAARAKERTFEHVDRVKPLLYVGGGRRSDVHQRLFAGWTNRLKGPLVSFDTHAPRFACDANTDIARLLLAWGLAQDELDLREIRPPSRTLAHSQARGSYEDQMVTKDQI